MDRVEQMNENLIVGWWRKSISFEMKLMSGWSWFFKVAFQWLSAESMRKEKKSKVELCSFSLISSFSLFLTLTKRKFCLDVQWSGKNESSQEISALLLCYSLEKFIFGTIWQKQIEFDRLNFDDEIETFAHLTDKRKWPRQGEYN